MNKILESKIQEHSVAINTSLERPGADYLRGKLALPDQAQGLIVLMHGSGSHRHSRPNDFLAEGLNRSRWATLLVNLLTPQEEEMDMRSQHFRFNVSLLAARLSRVTDWLQQHPATCHLQLGYFSAHTEGAAALIAANRYPHVVRALVCRSGRTDLVDAAHLPLRTPTLLIVGSDDFLGMGMNQDAIAQIQAEKRLAIIPGATHLMEEAGALDQSLGLAKQWFDQHLSSPIRIRNPRLLDQRGWVTTCLR